MKSRLPQKARRSIHLWHLQRLWQQLQSRIFVTISSLPFYLFLRNSLWHIPLLITISDNEQAHIKQFALQSHQHRTTVRGEWPQGPSPQLQQGFSLTLILPVILPLCSNHTDIRLPHCKLNGALPDFLLSPPINGSSVLFSPCPNGSFTHNQSALLLLKGFPKGSTICIHLQSKLLLFTLFCYQECSLKQINWHKYNLPLKRQ